MFSSKSLQLKKIETLYLKNKNYQNRHLVANDSVNVRKMRFDELRLEESRLFERSVDENDVHDVVADVTFAVQL